MAAAVTGVLYSLWAGKGKLSCYFFGIFNSAAYGWISFKAGLYGEVALNWGWYFPMMFAGLFFWKRNLKKEVQEYVKTHTAPYKYPRIVEFVDELPKTISGKVRRVEIRKKDLEKANG